MRDRVDREMTRETGQRDHEGVRREQASYRPTHYGMRAQDHGALLASLARKVNAFVDSHPAPERLFSRRCPRCFDEDMLAFFAEKNGIKCDESRQAARRGFC